MGTAEAVERSGNVYSGIDMLTLRSGYSGIDMLTLRNGYSGIDMVKD